MIGTYQINDFRTVVWQTMKCMITYLYKKTPEIEDLLLNTSLILLRFKFIN